MNTQTGTESSNTTVDVTYRSMGVITADHGRLVYWRRSTPNQLNADELSTLEKEQREMSCEMSVRNVQDEMFDLRCDAGSCLQRAAAADDWMATESKSRDYDYRALKALAQAKMLERLLEFLDPDHTSPERWVR